MHRTSAPYTDLTVVYSKSVSVVHASIRENARRAALAGDLAGEAWWADVQARYAGILFDAAVAGMRHLDRWAVTRVGMGRQVDDQQLGRYEDAGLVGHHVAAGHLPRRRPARPRAQRDRPHVADGQR